MILLKMVHQLVSIANFQVDTDYDETLPETSETVPGTKWNCTYRVTRIGGN